MSITLIKAIIIITWRNRNRAAIDNNALGALHNAPGKIEATEGSIWHDEIVPVLFAIYRHVQNAHVNQLLHWRNHARRIVNVSRENAAD